MSDRKAIIKAWSIQYRKASKKDKGRILDELLALTGTTAGMRSGCCDGMPPRRVRLVGDLRKQAKRTRQRLHDDAVLEKLKQLWAIMDCICGKRLAAILPEVITILEKHREIVMDAITRKKLLQISASSIDRLLAAERRKWMLRGRSGTKPGTLLKHQIPIRTFADWNEKQAGFVEIDLVGHDGGDASGDYCQTLDVTDVASTWTETGAVINKAQVWVFDALKSIRAHLPFPLLGIDSDNG